jgi:hypothetical protein
MCIAGIGSSVGSFKKPTLQLRSQTLHNHNHHLLPRIATTPDTRNIHSKSQTTFTCVSADRQPCQEHNHYLHQLCHSLLQSNMCQSHQPIKTLSDLSLSSLMLVSRHSKQQVQESQEVVATRNIPSSIPMNILVLCERRTAISVTQDPISLIKLVYATILYRSYSSI